ncbi:Uncharacterized protein BP5553_06798 [Venustampulla echinocandica]|uniref:NAD-dependent epimerase/dehydratase domain-containing protein n=1 Tax=Venustampulla echinocandica TaxID=2656787 RepID=A0A370TKY1_9HELO|nr:Uncharacterized protein BP5553_06798 [Venustampulla echinocandica]RDL36186.1 Uncharacterized protein BP5553_06798 [Venustampulla echinocandica]
MKLSASDLAIPTGSVVLVTGASGFIATHIVDQLLLAGYRVRGTVRDEKKVAWTTELFTERHGAGKFSAVIVPEMSIEGAFDEAVKGVQGVVHSAAVMTFSPDPNEVIPESIAGATGILRSAAKESSVKSFVLTSSSMAAAGGVPGPNKHFSIDASTWNDGQIKEAWSVTSAPFPPTHSSVVYGASKAEAEKAFWKFVEEEKPSFKVNTILPDANMGGILSLQGSLSTGNWIRMFYNGAVDFVKGLPLQWYVNVDDTARIHVAALVSKSVQNERIFAVAAPFNWGQIQAIFRKLRPSKSLPEVMLGAELSNMKVPNERGEQLLKDVFGRPGWNILEETVAENIKDLA